MLRSVNEIIGYRLFIKEEDIGKCDDLLFDDRWWTIRHMVADTGGWIIGNQVLVSPLLIKKPDWKTRHILLNITKEQLENCPSPMTDEPVSREHERKLFRYYGYHYYWTGTNLWGAGLYPAAVLPSIDDPDALESAEDVSDQENHLRSFREVKGYHIKAVDGKIGHVEDFILEDETWALRYLIVDTRNWFPGGKKVILSLDWVKSVSWNSSVFEVDLLKDQIQKSPEFDPSQPVNVEVEARLYDYYGRPLEKTIDRQVQQHIANPFI